MILIDAAAAANYVSLMNKITLFVQQPDETRRDFFTKEWELPRKELLSFESKLSGVEAADLAFHLTNAPDGALTKKELSLRGEFHGPSLSVGDVVRVVSPDGKGQEFLCNSIGWEARDVPEPGLSGPSQGKGAQQTVGLRHAQS